MRDEDRAYVLRRTLERRAERLIPTSGDMWPPVASRVRLRSQGSGSRRRMALAMSLAVVVLGVIASTAWFLRPTDEAQWLPTGALDSNDLTYNGQRYEPIAGPIRGELLDTNRLGTTGLAIAVDGPRITGEVRRTTSDYPVFTLPGQPASKAFLIGWTDKGTGGELLPGGGQVHYPACPVGSEGYVLTPIGSPDPSASPIELSANGLRSEGWPSFDNSDLLVRPVVYDGVVYGFLDSAQVTDANGEGRISPNDLDIVQRIAITYSVDPAPVPSPALEALMHPAQVTDYVDVYRFKPSVTTWQGNLTGPLLIADFCPAGTASTEYTLFMPALDQVVTTPTATPTPTGQEGGPATPTPPSVP